MFLEKNEVSKKVKGAVIGTLYEGATAGAWCRLVSKKSKVPLSAPSFQVPALKVPLSVLFFEVRCRYRHLLSRCRF